MKKIQNASSNKAFTRIPVTGVKKDGKKRKLKKICSEEVGKILAALSRETDPKGRSYLKGQLTNQLKKEERLKFEKSLHEGTYSRGTGDLRRFFSDLAKAENRATRSAPPPPTPEQHTPEQVAEYFCTKHIPEKEKRREYADLKDKNDEFFENFFSADAAEERAEIKKNQQKVGFFGLLNCEKKTSQRERRLTKKQNAHLDKLRAKQRAFRANTNCLLLFDNTFLRIFFYLILYL